MHGEIIKQLKKMRSIAPDEAFARNSRSIILGMSPDISINPVKQPSRWVIFAWSGALATFFLSLGISIIFSSPRVVLSSSLNENNINKELDSLLAGSIELKEIQYQQTVNQTIASALKEISDTKTKHLNTALLENEAAAFNVKETNNQEVDKLLDEILK